MALYAARNSGNDSCLWKEEEEGRIICYLFLEAKNLGKLRGSASEGISSSQWASQNVGRFQGSLEETGDPISGRCKRIRQKPAGGGGPLTQVRLPGTAHPGALGNTGFRLATGDSTILQPTWHRGGELPFP